MFKECNKDWVHEDSVVKVKVMKYNKDVVKDSAKCNLCNEGQCIYTHFYKGFQQWYSYQHLGHESKSLWPRP